MKKRVKIPLSNPIELLDLAKKVHAKHLADGEESLLRDLNWAEITPILEAALVQHERSTQLKREMLEAYQQRDIQLKTIIEALRDSRDILTGVYKKKMKVLGQWGYEVLDVRSATGVELKKE